jgi:predicted aspartyl protease
MGLTQIAGTVRGPSAEETLDFLVDSGATYTILPRHAWKMIGLTPQRTLTFRLADNTKIIRDISECYLETAMGKGHTPVVLGKAGDEPILGVVTLEQFGLILNPFSRTLQPMRLILA